MTSSIVGRGLIGVLLLISGNASIQAETMRCGSRIIDVGAHTVDVRRKCGEPTSREVFPPANNPEARTVETWVYGPDGGMFRYLRFIEGRLVEIRSRPE